MANLTITNTLVAGTRIAAAAHNTNYSDISTYINNRNTAAASWDGFSCAAAITITPTSNQIVLGVTNTTTISATAPSASRTVTIPDPGANASFVMTQGTQTISGAKTFDDLMSVAKSSAGSVFGATIQNSDNTNSGSHARLTIASGGSSGGNAFIYFNIIGATNWSFGIDNGDSDRIKLSAANVVGTSDVLSISTGAFDPIGGGTVSTGNATNYWNDVSYKTLTDRGCVPWCDDGVEVVGKDGKTEIVSDLTALCRIKKHPTQLTIHGLPKLDYSTFPKRAYRPADLDVTVVERDANDEPWYIDKRTGQKKRASDGVEMTLMWGVAIGAMKEIDKRLQKLEAKIAA